MDQLTAQPKEGRRGLRGLVSPVAGQFRTVVKLRDDGADRFERAFRRPMVLVALLVVPVVILEESSVTRGWRTLAAALNWTIWAAFATEFAVMLVVSRGKVKLGWLVRHPIEVLIVFLTCPAYAGVFRVLRLFRLLRLLAIPTKLRLAFSPQGIKLSALFAAVAAFSGAAIFADYEKDRSLWDGVWWSITTMATVGYGDLSPKSVAGRLAGMSLMFIGISFFALVTGAVAQRFLSEEVREIEQDIKAESDTELTTREQVLRELREVSARLRRLERAVEDL